MTDDTTTDIDTPDVIDGEIRRGFDRYYRREYHDGRVEIFSQNRMHSFDAGYQDHGPRLTKTHKLTEADARAVIALLTDWLEHREDESDA